MSNDKGLDSLLELAVHIILVLVGIIAIGGSAFIRPGEDFWRPLLINIGSSLIVVTLVFAIFETFRRENAETIKPKQEELHEMMIAESYKQKLQASQHPPIRSADGDPSRGEN